MWVDGPQRAVNSANCHLKEAVMKHLIITATVCLGLVVQSAGPGVNPAPQTNNGQSIASTLMSAQSNSQQLSATEMETLVGGDASGCWEYVDENNDRHGICCVDLWIITVCVGVNLSAIERLLTF
jgi:hypothetical protein